MANVTSVQTRQYLQQWQNDLSQNVLFEGDDFIHTLEFYFPQQAQQLKSQLLQFGERVAKELEPLVNLNNQDANLPKIEKYNSIGILTETIVHHPSYISAGDIIYSSDLMKRMATPGGLLESLLFFYISSHAGEAGHNCPIACSAGIIRLLTRVENIPGKNEYLRKLTAPLFTTNFTGAQFLTEIQGGSDVGQNAAIAICDDKNNWRISGEKWFCSNANADLFLLTARFDESKEGTKGLALFLVPATLEDNSRNNFSIRRLKEKIGTRTLATAEIDFTEAHAYLVGEPSQGFKLMMENVLHISRLFNTFAVLGISNRAWQIAYGYAKQRIAFGKTIINYPLVQENLAIIKAEQTAMLAAICTTTKLQDEYDTGKFSTEENKLLLRLLVNLNKYFSAKQSVEHVHHCLDILAGNGAIESFSPIPRLLRDSIVCENWEGTHYTLWMQILRDIHTYKIDEIYLDFLNSELLTLDDENFSDECKQLSDLLNNLSLQIKQLKAANESLQTLLIKDVVKQMILIFCGLCLLKESIDQKNNYNKQTKLDCFYLFVHTHFVKNPTYDLNYLELISKFTLQH